MPTISTKAQAFDQRKAERAMFEVGFVDPTTDASAPHVRAAANLSDALFADGSRQADAERRAAEAEDEACLYPPGAERYL